MTDREMIESFCAMRDLEIVSWDEEHENGPTANLGLYRVTHESEDEGLYLEDEGELSACVVGAEKYGNRRVSVSFLMEGYDYGVEVTDLHGVERVVE